MGKVMVWVLNVENPPPSAPTPCLEAGMAGSPFTLLASLYPSTPGTQGVPISLDGGEGPVKSHMLRALAWSACGLTTGPPATELPLGP